MDKRWTNLVEVPAVRVLAELSATRSLFNQSRFENVEEDVGLARKAREERNCDVQSDD